MKLPSWFPRVGRPFNREWADTWDSMTDNEKRWSFLFDAALVVVVLGIAILLSGCEDREVSRSRNEQKLPRGCRIVDLDYGDLTAAVICEKQSTKTTARAWDEPMTILVYDPNLKTTLPQVTTVHYRSLVAQIESEP